MSRTLATWNFSSADARACQQTSSAFLKPEMIKPGALLAFGGGNVGLPTCKACGVLYLRIRPRKLEDSRQAAN